MGASPVSDDTYEFAYTLTLHQEATSVPSVPRQDAFQERVRLVARAALCDHLKEAYVFAVQDGMVPIIRRSPTTLILENVISQFAVANWGATLPPPSFSDCWSDLRENYEFSWRNIRFSNDFL